MEALLSHLATNVIGHAGDAVGSLLSPSAPPPQHATPQSSSNHVGVTSTGSAREAGAGTTDTVTSKQYIDTSPSTVSVPMSNMAPMRLPFRLYLGQIIVQPDGAYTDLAYSISASVGLQTLSAHFRRARLTRLSFRAEPSYQAIDHPFTLDMCWCAANAPPTSGNELTVPGARRITYTNVTSGNADNVCVEAPLQAMNPMIKDSIAYTDTPYVMTRVFGKTTGNVNVGEMYIEGEIEVSHAALHGTANH